MKKLWLATALLAAWGVSGLATADSARRVVRSEVMIGYHETPALSSTGSGDFVAEIDDDAQVISFVFTYAGLEGGNSLFAHIHVGQRGVAGGVSAFLCGGSTKPAPCPNVEGTVTGTITPADIVGPLAQGVEAGSWAELVRAMRAGVAYVNIHTTRWPAGEIRGQISDQDQRNAR